MQHETALGLHRPAKINRHLLQVRLMQRNIDLVEHLAQRQADRAIQHDAQRAVLVVLADVSQRAGKDALLHGGHGNQKMMVRLKSDMAAL